MAKKSFHETRGITFQELGALLGTRNMLAAGMLQMAYAEVGDDIERTADPDETNCHLFNMNVAGGVNNHCGSVGCIGGTMAMIMGLRTHWDIRTYVATRAVKQKTDAHERKQRRLVRSPSLAPLFFPPGGNLWEMITPAMAVQAIDNWLNTGDPHWETAIGPDLLSRM